MGKRARGGGKAKSKQQEQQKRGGRRTEGGGSFTTVAHRRPECPPTFRCHQCEGNHWTIDCPRIRREPHRFPKVDVQHGCFQCGQRGHTMNKCFVVREKCKACGGSHATSSCPFTYIPQEWHEFYDPTRQRVFFCLSTDPLQVPTWNVPPNHLDVILWYCDACKVLLPDTLKECVKCHALRPVNVMHSSDEEEENEEHDSSSDEEEGSSSDNDDGEEKEEAAAAVDGDVPCITKTERVDDAGVADSSTPTDASSLKTDGVVSEANSTTISS
mmetsp:Transcript_13051/g.14981  ORF Transcript_13051/g.14981 Transcript_13051/m.14981 type:complete len:271 (+) Transcript_13051:54-866(+)